MTLTEVFLIKILFVDSFPLMLENFSWSALFLSFWIFLFHFSLCVGVWCACDGRHMYVGQRTADRIQFSHLVASGIELGSSSLAALAPLSSEPPRAPPFFYKVNFIFLLAFTSPQKRTSSWMLVHACYPITQDTSGEPGIHSKMLSERRQTKIATTKNPRKRKWVDF